MFRLAGIGQVPFVAHCDVPDFRFGGDARPFCQFHDFRRDSDILLHRQIGTVEHDGGAAPSDRVFHLLQACAVVEVDRDRLTGFFREFAEQGNQHFRLAVAEHAGIHLNDDGTFH